MFRKFKFEEARYESLQGIPLSTRHKFETIGVEMDEGTWRALALEERKVFCHLPVRSQGERDAYREFLSLALQRKGRPLSNVEASRWEAERREWENPGRIPSRVLETAFRLGCQLQPMGWLSLDDMERYALYRLASDDDGSFRAACAEFLKPLAPSRPA